MNSFISSGCLQIIPEGYRVTVAHLPPLVTVPIPPIAPLLEDVLEDLEVVQALQEVLDVHEGSPVLSVPLNLAQGAHGGSILGDEVVVLALTLVP
jgi:hypothetical protein